jgi:hypothetical protein
MTAGDHPAESGLGPFLAERGAARGAVKLFQARGFNRGQDVVAGLEILIAETGT